MPDERGDDVVEALDTLAEAVQQNKNDEQVLVDRVQGLKRARLSGSSMTEAFGREPLPGTMQVLGQMLGRLMEASGTARRSLARAMRSEGTSIPQIARLFGVTHQRISNILARPAAVPSPVLHEPSGTGAVPSPAPGGDTRFGTGGPGPSRPASVSAAMGDRNEEDVAEEA